jgi:hypothetical protein
MVSAPLQLSKCLANELMLKGSRYGAMIDSRVLVVPEVLRGTGESVQVDPKIDVVFDDAHEYGTPGSLSL